MISRQHFLDNLLRETHIIKHLYTKIPADAFDFRPTEKQRSTLELMRYLASCGTASMHVLLHGSDWSQWKTVAQRNAEMKPEEFLAAMDQQAEDMTRMLTAIPEEDFFQLEVKHPNGEAMPLGTGLIRMTMSWLTAYRMQLFLYAKQAGATEINTSNCWAGEDRKPKAN